MLSKKLKVFKQILIPVFVMSPPTIHFKGASSWVGKTLWMMLFNFLVLKRLFYAEAVGSVSVANKDRIASPSSSLKDELGLAIESSQAK